MPCSCFFRNSFLFFLRFWRRGKFNSFIHLSTYFQWYRWYWEWRMMSTYNGKECYGTQNIYIFDTENLFSYKKIITNRKATQTSLPHPLIFRARKISILLTLRLTILSLVKPQSIEGNQPHEEHL